MEIRVYKRNGGSTVEPLYKGHIGTLWKLSFVDFFIGYLDVFQIKTCLLELHFLK